MSRSFYLGGALREDWRPDGLYVEYAGAAEIHFSAGLYTCDDPRLEALLNNKRPPTNGTEVLLRRYAALAGDESATAGSDDLWILERLRLLLDIRHMGWDRAKAEISNQLTCRFPQVPEAISLTALKAVQPRLVALACVLAEEIARQVAERWPHDLRRRTAFAVCRNGYLDAGVLRYHCAGHCAGTLSICRDFYVLAPEKFEV